MRSKADLWRWLAGWLAVAGCLAGRLPGRAWIEKV